MLESCLYARGVRDTVFPYSTRPKGFTLVEISTNPLFLTREEIIGITRLQDYSLLFKDGSPDKDKRRRMGRSKCERRCLEKGKVVRDRRSSVGRPSSP